MLQRQEEQQTETPAPLPRGTTAAGSQRVTSDELTEALSALEARREEETRRVQSTLSIDEAVRDLGLDVTPEEVWKQIEAHRTEKARQAAHEDEAHQKAQPAPASGPSLADTARETARVMALQAQKLAEQASATAQQHLAASAAQSKAQEESRQAAYERHTAWRGRMTRPPRRRNWGATIGMIGLLALGVSWFSHGHGVTVTADHQTLTYDGSHKIAVVDGSADKIVFRGSCETLVVDGSHDNVSITGRVRHVIANGDGNAVTWSAASNSTPPAIVNTGSGNLIQPDTTPTP
jgi:hypothetical protein